MNEEKPLIAVSMGDPAGVGPEVVLKAFADDSLYEAARPVVYGDVAWLRKVNEKLLLLIEPVAIDDITSVEGRFGRLDVIDFANVSSDLLIGKVSKEAGAAALCYIEAAARAALSGDARAIVTAPVSKEALRMAGSVFSGHTDMLAAMDKTSRYAMTLVAGEMRAIFVTDHIPLSQVPVDATKGRILETIELAARALLLLGEGGKKIAVCGINPHSGEAGIMGSEEDEEIAPAIREARERGINCEGPIPGDTAFFRNKSGEFAMVVAMYHDQGHAPLKLVAFDTGVNWTVGLSFVRTSPDHGTAFDIAGTGKARADSFKHAFFLARDVARRKKGEKI